MLSWFRQIDDARSVGELLAVARDYLATWTPEELARLPQDCRPGRMRDAFDIEQLHATLADEYRRDRLGPEDLFALQRITSFMVRASVRLAELQRDDRRDEGDRGGGSEEPHAKPPQSSAARESES